MPQTLSLTVTEVIEESPDVRSLVFDMSELDYRPGQFLTLRVPSTQTGSVARCYSLASSPHTDAAPKVTVKRIAGGYASNWLCDNVSPGDRLEVLPPAGLFTPPDLDAGHRPPLRDRRHRQHPVDVVADVADRTKEPLRRKCQLGAEEVDTA